MCAWTIGRRPKLGSGMTTEPEEVKINPIMRDPSVNDKVLVDVKDDHPIFRVAMDYLCVGYEDNLDAAMDARQSPEMQRNYLNRAAGIREVIGNIYTTRARLVEERKHAQERAAKREDRKT